MSPVGVTIGLFTDVRALGPAFYTLKIYGKRFVLDKFKLFHGGFYFLIMKKNVASEFAVLLI